MKDLALVRALAVGLAFGAVGCDSCSKKPATADLPETGPVATASAPPSSAPAASAEPDAAVKEPEAAKAGNGARPTSDAGPSASSAPSSAPSAAPSASSAKAANSDLPKPCTDGMGRLGLLTFTDVGGGKVRISSSKASASCVRTAATQYQCDWVVDGKPTGSFPARFDPANKSVQGSIAKGQMFTCPPSSQR